MLMHQSQGVSIETLYTKAKTYIYKNFKMLKHQNQEEPIESFDTMVDTYIY